LSAGNIEYFCKRIGNHRAKITKINQLVFLYFYFRKIRPMEPKILLQLIRDDISHLQGIASEFSKELQLTPEEVELAIVRTNGLLRQLELLHKLLVKADKSLLQKETNVETFKNPCAEKDQNVLFVETSGKKPGENLIEIPKPVSEIELSSLVCQESVATPTIIIPEIRDNKEELSAGLPDQEFKNQSEESCESMQMVNDLLVKGKSESGYPVIPIKSIWDGIGINDRILFVRELFENDNSKFETAVTALNQLSTIQEAVNYLKMNFKWRKTEASQHFLILVKRRFTI